MISSHFKLQFPGPLSSTKNGLRALAILLLGLIMTGIATHYAQKEGEDEAVQEFVSVCNEIKIKTLDRLHANAQLLMNGAAFIQASDTVSRSAWKSFNEHSKYQKYLPGIHGLGYSIVIPQNQIGRHLKMVQKEGYAEYTIKPAGKRDLYTSVIYMEPFSDVNLYALGYDMFTEPIRRKAMEMSRDSDTAIMSAKVMLLQEVTMDLQPGIIMYVPVYHKGFPTNTAEQRQRAIQGWVYSPYHLNDLMSGRLSRWNSTHKSIINMQIYESQISDSSLLYDSQNNYSRIKNNSKVRTYPLQINLLGIQWVMLFKQTTQTGSFFTGQSGFVFLGGLFISLLLFLLSLSFLNSHFRGQKITAELTIKHLESEKRILEVLENSQDASYKRNLTTQKYEYLSPVFADISGYTPMELEARPLGDIITLIHPEDVDETDRIIAKALSDNTVSKYKLEYRFKHKDGQYRWFQDRFTIVRNINLQPEAMIGSVSDITERKNAQEQLLREKLLLRTIIDNIPDSIYCMDVDCRKTLANATDWLYMGAKSEAEVLGKDDFAFYPKELAEAFFAVDQSVIQTGEPLLNCEESLIDGNGVKRYLLSSKLPITDKDNRIIGLLGIGRDITERREAEEEVKRKNEELQKLNSAKDKFFSIIAHDLRSPFNGFLGLSQILVEELSTLSTEEVQMIAVSMQDSATTLYRLLENLLEWAKMQQGLIIFNPEILPLKPLVDSCLVVKQLKAQSKNIEIITQIPEDIEVKTDNNMLQTIIRNLVSNSVKFTGKGGKIIVAAKYTQDNFVEISIKDNGIGMNQGMIDGLFQLGFNTGRPGTAGETSTGLGLFICKDFVEKHGGKLWVVSEEGKGSTFSFTIPGKAN